MTNNRLINAQIRGIVIGAYVSWEGANKRFGCVMSFDGLTNDGCIEVQASNARVRVSLDRLHAEPLCTDAITADQHSIYGV